MTDLTPLGDFVMVKRLPDEEMVHGIAVPATARDKREGVRRGLVIAIGKGDRLLGMMCQTCHAQAWRALQQKFQHCPDGSVGWRVGRKCHTCGGTLTETGDESRAEMNVSVGDTILYHRAPANDIRMGNTEYVLLHEEQHILAVVE